MVYRIEMNGNNKVAVPYANYIKQNAPTFTFDTVADMNAAIQNGDVPAGAVMYCKQETPGGVSGDSALDPNSTNWVQNSAITAAINKNVNDINNIEGQISAINSDLGDPSSASSVTGADAFSKISTLSSDLASMNEVVQISVNGTETYGQLLFRALRDHIVLSKVSPSATLHITGLQSIYHVTNILSNGLIMGTSTLSSSKPYISGVMMLSNGTGYVATYANDTTTDYSNNVATGRLDFRYR